MYLRAFLHLLSSCCLLNTIILKVFRIIDSKALNRIKHVLTLMNFTNKSKRRERWDHKIKKCKPCNTVENNAKYRNYMACGVKSIGSQGGKHV